MRNFWVSILQYVRLFQKPHRKATLLMLAALGAIAIALGVVYTPENGIAWSIFSLLIFWGRKVWVTDDYDRAERAAADAERARQEARREREARRAPPPSVSSLYAVLGLSENATDTEIRTAYRKLVRRYHPDRSRYSKAANTEMFRQVQEAYAELRNKRGSWVN